MKLPLRPTLGLAVAAVALALLPTAFAQKTYIYVNGNESLSGSTIRAFSNDGTGKLTALAGSPYSTGGVGVGPGNKTDKQWDADGEIIINAAGTRLFAVNGHTNNIAVFNIAADGTLSAVAGSPFSSGGPQPASLALTENYYTGGDGLVVVANKDSDPLQTPTAPNYTALRYSVANGTLSINNNSTLTRPAGVSLAQVNFIPGGPSIFVANEFINKTLASYQLDADGGSMTQIGSIAPPFTVSGVLNGSIFHPNPAQQYYYTGQPDDRRFIVSSYTTAGALTYLKSVSNSGKAICWLSINPAGTRLVDSETASASITSYDITNPVSPVLSQHLTLKNTLALLPRPAHQVWDPTAAFLYVVDRNAYLHIVNADATGTLTESATPFKLGLPAGTVPVGIAVLRK